MKLAADVDSHSGCSMYAVVREMSKRKAVNSTDKVAGLGYLLRLTQLPTYDEKVSDDDAWKRCVHMLPCARKMELLFDFPYRSEKEQWFPAWSELMKWPEVDPDCDYPTTQSKEHEHLGIQLQDLGDPDKVATEGSLFVSDIWALSYCHVTYSSAQGVDYEPKVGTKVYGFYSPYLSQKPIGEASILGHECEFTIVTADLGHSNNWAVCKLVKTLKARCNPISGSTSCKLNLIAKEETSKSEMHPNTHARLK